MTYQDEQFQKINKLNNDLLKISQYVQSNITDFEYLEQKIEDNSVELEEVQRQLKETQDSAETFYQMFFDTQPQRVEEELVEEKENRTQDLQSTPAPERHASGTSSAASSLHSEWGFFPPLWVLSPRRRGT